MVTLLLPRLLRPGGTFRRAGSVTERNVAALRSMYWFVLLSGCVEPLLYLFSIGVGVGALIDSVPLPGGRPVGYAAFVAPAMLAAAAMAGALNETTLNFYGKMKFMRLYDGILATPVRPIEIALGELAWAMVRGTVYATAFVAVMVAMHLTTPARALLALAAAILVGFTFGALGLAVSTVIRSWQDFDLIASAQFAMLLFSGTFVPATAYPTWFRWLIEATPLYRAVDLTRAVTLDHITWLQVLDVLYLFTLLTACLATATHRMEKLLCR